MQQASESTVKTPEVTHRYDTGEVHPEAAIAERDPWVGHDAYQLAYRSLHQAGLPLQAARLRLHYRKIGMFRMAARRLNYRVAVTLKGLIGEH